MVLRWLTKLNDNKCKCMTATRPCSHTVPFTYNLSNNQLSLVTDYKYFGVHITRNLSGNMHVNYIIKNDSRMLLFLRRNLSSVTVTLKLQLWKT